MKIALGLEYCGSRYSGWQRQSHSRSIQECVEQAITQVANHPVEVVCAGRTDAGVHASKQIIHFKTTAQRSPRSWALGISRYLPSDISALWAQPVNEDFHARFSATSRSYRYYLLQRPSPPAILHQQIAWRHQPLHLENMQTAADCLLGKHDFTSFRATGCQAKTALRTIFDLKLSRINACIVLQITADAFLYHMVRNIMGTLVAIGLGKHPPKWCREVLEARNRKLAGSTAPARGLYLYDVAYPTPYTFPAPSSPLGMPL
ncbi:MAG: tRNA pseudouridine(38-40) synthase TruA [Candidatus Eutrophobiaceae bacterium]